MQTLKFTLTLCAISGCWQPLSWTSPSKQIMYNGYRVLLICLISAFAISQFMNIILNINNSDEISDSMYMTLAVFIGTYKLIILWKNDKNIIAIINALAEKPFSPLESQEVIIQRKYDEIIK